MDLWCEIIKGLPSAVVALVIGLIAARIAGQQNATSKAKLKFDLFDKRYEIFQQTWSFLSQASQIAKNESPFHSFTNLIPQAGFLFGSDIEKYLNVVSQKHTKLWAIYIETKANNDVVPHNHIETLKELENWFLNEAGSGVKLVFSPYLSFEKVRL